ncbi:TetR/AcrR family transcriptional regulator [Mumia zhuanghuii]|uniref:TetR/AcrR family transcriptional regulator n=2 Tax=Mumia TaxID=1546255 RepID=A0ABW1QNI2_9ACTN|nr:MULTISPECIES: TetR/AcrR family transcriptional regulator [Mumia]KAA1422162.1 TetR/AcrR family transcriptional regulator [Mumia zhuanghuii]
MPKRFNGGGSELQRLRARPADAGNAIPEDHILDAAADGLVEHGLDRLTMADIAARAGVARATLYRRWENVRSVVAALLTREWVAVIAEANREEIAVGRDRLVDAVVRTAAMIRVHPVQKAVVESDPEFLVPYVFQRMGRTSTHVIQVLENGIREGHADGSIRPLDVALQARTVLLLAWSFTITAPMLTGSTDTPGPTLDELDGQLAEALDRYLAPEAPQD